jgi:membrane protein DedA with SNARE-associated domain
MQVVAMNLWDWMGGFVQNYGYTGAFLISIFGNFTIFFPVPYVLTIYAFGATLNPLLLGVVCGLGSTIGEFSAYLVGRGGRELLEERYGKRLESAKMLIKRYGMLVIFLFALLPLPDDLILIPLGMLKYSLRKALVAAFLGKVALCIIVAYAGRFSFTYIRDIFESGGILGGIASILLLIIIIIAMIKIDWSRFIGERVTEEEN